LSKIWKIAFEFIQIKTENFKQKNRKRINRIEDSQEKERYVYGSLVVGVVVVGFKDSG